MKGEVTEYDFDYVMDKLMLTITTYKQKYPELQLLEDYIHSLNINNESSRLAYLLKISQYSNSLSPTYYVIRFMHYRFERDVNDFIQGEFVQDKYPYYLEFADI